MRYHPIKPLILCIVLGGGIGLLDRAHGQGIERASESGEGVADELRQSSDNQAYNLRIGPVTLRSDADLSFAFNDNVNLDKDNRTADLIVTPFVNLHAKWPVTDINSLTLDLGLGYQAYVLHPQDNSVLLAPNSQAQFNFFIGDVAINLHEIFSYQQDPLSIGQLSNQTQLGRFQNDVGVRGTYDLDAFIFTLGYDHENLWVTQTDYDYLTNQSDVLTPKITFKLSKTLDTGLTTSFSDVRYDKDVENNYTTVSAGPFVTATLTSNISVDAQIEAYIANYAHGGTNGDTESVDSYIGSAGITHRVNDYITQSLTVGREFIPGLTSNYTQRVYANYTNSWKATSYINTGLNLWWENLDDSEASIREMSNRYGTSLYLDYTVTQHATLNLSYQYVLKEANPSDLSYYQNLLTIGSTYQF